MSALGVGNIKVISDVYGKNVECTIKNVLYVPTLRRNLLSVKRLEMASVKVVFNNGQVKLYNNEGLLGIGYRKNLYEIAFKVRNAESLTIESEDQEIKL